MGCTRRNATTTIETALIEENGGKEARYQAEWGKPERSELDMEQTHKSRWPSRYVWFGDDRTAQSRYDENEPHRQKRKTLGPGDANAESHNFSQRA